MAEFGKLNFSTSFNPTSAFPLDARCYFTDLISAQAAAATAEEVGSTNTNYHFGMKLLVDDGKTSKWYEIQRDGTLSEEVTSYRLMEPATVLEPAKYYVFGEVSSLDVTLKEDDSDLVSEYCFEFVAKEDFDTLKITPEPRWATPVQFVAGKTHQISILRGIGVMVCA